MAKEFAKIKDAEEPAAMVKQFIEAEDSEHWYLRDARIGLLWVTPNMVKKGKLTIAAARRATSLLGYYSKCDFIIEISKDAWAELTSQEKLASMDHELRHCSVTADAEELKTRMGEGDQVEFVWTIRPHDAEVFAADMVKNSATPGVENFKKQVRQLELDFAAADKAGGNKKVG